MSPQTSYKPTPTNQRTSTTVAPQPQAPKAQSQVELTDDLLDEIDACLEENALETVRTFRQKGGQ